MKEEEAGLVENVANVEKTCMSHVEKTFYLSIAEIFKAQ